MIVGEYVARYEELVKFFLHCNGMVMESSKCIKFESGVHPELKKRLGYQEIR